MNIYAKLSKIQQEFKCKKSAYNSFGKYYFRKAEDILEALKPLEAKYNVAFMINEELVVNDPAPIIKSTATIYCCDEPFVPVEDGEPPTMPWDDGYNFRNSISANAIVGVDLNQKGMQTPQQFGSASSYAKKYALGNLLLIDDTQDSDASNTHGNDNRFQKPAKQAGNSDSLGF